MVDAPAINNETSKRSNRVKKKRVNNARSSPVEKTEGSKDQSDRKVDHSMETKSHYLSGSGTNHPVMEMIQNMRETFLRSGFDEIIHPLILNKNEIKKQFGKEKDLIFDNLYFLARIPRRSICTEGSTHDDILKKMDPDKVEPFLEMVHQYCNGDLEGIHLLDRAVSDIGMERELALEVLESILDQGHSEPIITDNILRWHMTSSWYPIISALWKSTTQPIKLFTTGLRVRYDPKYDEELGSPSRFSASCVIIDSAIDMDKGLDILEELLERLDLGETIIERRHIASSDYDRGMEYTIQMRGKEIGNCGMYSEEARLRYGIDVPIFNINMGLERVLMIQKGYRSVSDLLFPQFTRAWRLTDQELAKSIQFISTPETKIGEEIAKAISKTALENWEKPGPSTVTAWEGEVELLASSLVDPKSKRENDMESSAPTTDTTTKEPIQGVESKNRVMLKVSIISRESGGTLCGPALENHVMVKDGNIIGVRPKRKDSHHDKDTTPSQDSGIRFIDGFSHAVAAEVEALLRSRGELRARTEIYIRMVHGMEDLNLKVSERGKEFMLHCEKTTDIRGPMHMSIQLKFSQVDEPMNHIDKS